MTTRHEHFIDYLVDRGWMVLRTGAEASPVHSPAGSAAHGTFLALYTQLSNAADTRWFLSAADYAGATDSAFAWDAFRSISLEAAASDADRQSIQAFWARYLPVFMSVDGDYEFLALDRESGKVVHGIEPEFEDVSEVAVSLDALFEQVLAGGKAAAWFG